MIQYFNIRGVIRSNGLKITEDAHRTVFLVIIESDGLRHAARQTNSPSVILCNSLAPGGFTATCAYLCHDKVAHILTVRSPDGQGARVHGDTVLYPLEQDRKGMLVSSTIWKSDWHKVQWMAFDNERGGREGAILVMTRAIPEDPSPCIYLEAIDRTLYRNASGRRTGIAEQLLDETDRMSRLVLLDLLYTHLHMIEDEKVFRQCFRHIFEAHYRVYEATGILRRDISTDNLMIRVGSDGSKQGVLIDWDLASKVIDEQDHTGTRTGTRAFMAYELFNPETPKHILRFDWESFLYYLMWVVFVIIDEEYMNAETKRIQNETGRAAKMKGLGMAKWPKLADKELWREKGYAMSMLSKDASPRSVYKFQSTFSTWIEPIWERFRRGHNARVDRDPNFNNETLGGLLTYEGLRDILDSETN
ncbi:hypothetical protein ACEPAI_9622 [Sanghuangporus weigelae]